jgi:hypothetical protein
VESEVVAVERNSTVQTLTWAHSLTFSLLLISLSAWSMGLLRWKLYWSVLAAVANVLFEIESELKTLQGVVRPALTRLGTLGDWWEERRDVPLLNSSYHLARHNSRDVGSSVLGILHVDLFDSPKEYNSKRAKS